MIEDLNTVLAAYEDAEAAGGARLADWLDRYPQFEAELARYAVYSYVAEHGRPEGDEAVEEARFREIAREVRVWMMAAQGATFARPLASLVDAASERGIPVPELARWIGLSPLEVVKLNQRLFRAASIPLLLVQRLAETLERSFDEIADYLRQPPTLARQAAYKASEAPRLAAQEEFGAAVAASSALSEEQKAAWAEAASDTLSD